MLRRSLVLALALILAAACGGSSQASTPTASSVSVQSADMPKGMMKCNLSGDIDSLINKEKAGDPNTAKSMGDYWQQAKQMGAKATYVAFYADNSTHCSSLSASNTDVGAANYKLVVNFVVQFKDEASAVKGYQSGSVFGFSAAQLKSSGSGVPVVEGSKTGLSPNSIVVSAAAGTQSYYIAVWQKKAFMVILALLNVDSESGKKAASAENGRIS